jgi:hypothetical protein
MQKWRQEGGEGRTTSSLKAARLFNTTSFSFKNLTDFYPGSLRRFAPVDDGTSTSSSLSHNPYNQPPSSIIPTANISPGEREYSTKKPL